MSEAAGPYRVEQLNTPRGPRWRLVGPGLDDPKSYPWEEFREKLAQMAALMNFAWQQCEARRADKGSTSDRDQTTDRDTHAKPQGHG